MKLSRLNHLIITFTTVVSLELSSSPDNYVNEGSPQELLDFPIEPDFPLVRPVDDTQDSYFLEDYYLEDKVIREVEEVLAEFVNTLKTFICDPIFDVERFQNKELRLSRELSDITKWIEQASPNNKELKDLLRFPTQMFAVMKQATYTIRYLNQDHTAQLLARHLVQLNIVLLGLHDAHGAPDPKTPDFVNTVNYCEQNLNSWIAIYKTLRDVAFTASIMFEAQSIRATRTIEVMKSYFPEEES